MDEIPYDFVCKRLSIVAQDEARQLWFITKGALYQVLEVCHQVRDGDTLVLQDEAHRTRIQQHFATWSRQGFRVLGVATKPIPPQLRYSLADERDLMFAGEELLWQVVWRFNRK